MTSKWDFEKHRHLLFEGGRAKSAALFEETCVDKSVVPLFKLSEWHDTYMSMADPTEYSTAMALIGNWEFWNKLKESASVGPYMKAWKEELEIMLRSKGMIALMQQAEKGNAQAARYLADGEYFIAKKGRKSKAEREAEEHLNKAVSERVRFDMERLGLKVVGGTDAV